jgi:hypothetical protein
MDTSSASRARAPPAEQLHCVVSNTFPDGSDVLQIVGLRRFDFPNGVVEIEEPSSNIVIM